MTNTTEIKEKAQQAQRDKFRTWVKKLLAWEKENAKTN